MIIFLSLLSFSILTSWLTCRLPQMPVSFIGGNIYSSNYATFALSIHSVKVFSAKKLPPYRKNCIYSLLGPAALNLHITSCNSR